VKRRGKIAQGEAPGVTLGFGAFFINSPERAPEMAQTLVQVLLHVVFSTKERHPFLKEVWRDELFAYMGGIVRNLGGVALSINGVADHVHLLLSLPATLAPADAVRVIKSRSSAWVRGRERNFSWQSGYAAFSVSQSKAAQVRAYIAAQQQHHRRIRFEDEFVSLLRRHRMDYDERYLWS
jgi:REP element-mobilizing transposase RayT